MTNRSSAFDQDRGLQALLGLTVIGLVWTTVYFFAFPKQAIYNPTAWGAESALDLNIWKAKYIFVEDKFHVLLALLFGAGCAAFFERTRKRPQQVYFAHMLILFGIGIVHGVVLADHDVLGAYALAGLLLPAIVRRSSRTLLIVAVIFVFIHIVFGSFFAAAQSPRYWELNYGIDTIAIDITFSRGEEDLSDRVSWRIERLPRSIVEMIGFLPLNLASMLVGLAAWKSGLLTGQWRLRRLLIVGLACVFPAGFALAYFMMESSASGYAAVTIALNSLILSAPLDLLMSVGYAALAMAVFQYAQGSLGVRLLASVGGLWLTNYLVTSVLFAAIFASWGLGLFGQMSRSEAFGLSFIPIVGALFWSPAWHNKFGRGPIERVWYGAARFFS